jgi:hypothetical protein
LVLGLLLPCAAAAQVIDRVDVQAVGEEAEIIVRFTTQVQYQRHTPPAQGADINIFLQLQGYEGGEEHITQVVRRVAKNNLIDDITITYPETNGSMSVHFAGPTRFRVRPGTDVYSISIFVPAKSPQSNQPQSFAPVAPAAAAALVTPPKTVVAQPRVVPGIADVVVAPAAPAPSASPAPDPTAAPATPATVAATAAANTDSQTAAPAATPAPIMTNAEAATQGQRLLDQARTAYNANDLALAVATLNAALNLPTNPSSAGAQELIGQVRETNGEIDKARAEYELFLKLYPQGEGAARVKDRLAKMNAAAAALAAAPAAPTEAPTRQVRRQEDTGWKLTGGISQYRYFGTSQTTTDPPRVTICDPSATVTSCPPNTISSAQAALQSANPNTVSHTVQNNLMSSIDLTERRRTETTDSRFVIRDVDMSYFGHLGNSSAPSNRLNAAYFEQTNREAGTQFRIGRQYASGGGLSGRFDGLSGSYTVSPTWKVNGAFGKIDELYSPYKKSQYGLSVDMQAPAEHWGGSAYVVEQRFDSLVDRRAVGLDARYFDEKKNFYANIDYDIDFKVLNSFMFQANWQPGGAASFWANFDRRRSPMMLLSSAVDATQMTIATLTGGTATSVGTPLTLAEIRKDLDTITPTSNTFAVGMSYALTQKWQLGADFHISSLSGSSASEFLPIDSAGVLTFRPDPANPFRPASRASGTTLGYTAQAIGNNQIWANDILVISGSYFDATRSLTGAYTGESLSFNHVAVPNDKWRFDTALRFYFQHTIDTGQKTSRINPSFKVSYRLRENLNLEGEINIDRSTQTGGSQNGSPIPDTRDLSKFYYFGYRWDWL